MSEWERATEKENKYVESMTENHWTRKQKSDEKRTNDAGD